LQVARDLALLRGVPQSAAFYFVHSYFVVPTDDQVVVARTDHGVDFVSMIARGNLYATQFHPEKSQRAGLKLLKNFAELS
jgi:glutamine amidotransferase